MGPLWDGIHYASLLKYLVRLCSQLLNDKVLFGFAALYWAFSRRKELSEADKARFPDPVIDTNAVHLSNYEIRGPRDQSIRSRLSDLSFDQYDYDSKTNFPTHVSLPLRIEKVRI